MAKKKKIEFTTGDVFLIPLEGGDSFGVGMVIEKTPDALNSILCGFYDIKSTSKDELNVQEIASGKPISIQFITPDLIEDGYWEVVGNTTPIEANEYFDFDGMKANGYIGAEVEGSAIIRKFLSAYQGVYHWNCYYKDDYFDELLLNPDIKPDRIYFIDK